MNHTDIIKGYLPTLIEQYKRGENPKQLTKEVFKDANIATVTDAINIVRDSRKESDGEEKFYRLDSFPSQKGQMPAAGISGTDSNLYALYGLLVNKLKQMQYADLSYDVRANMVYTLMPKVYRDSLNTQKMGELIGQIINITPARAKDAINDADASEKADSELHKYFPDQFSPPSQ